MHDPRRLLTRQQVMTVPNAMSALRIVLIPFFIWAYVEERYTLSFGLVVASAVSDMLDGFVARKLNMISDFGKFIDPVADKLTQAALVVCLMTKHPHIFILFIILAVKELATLALSAVVFSRHDSVNSAKWYGKMCTVVFEGTMMLLILCPEAEEKTVHMAMVLCGAVMIFAFVMYVNFYHSILRGKRKSENR